MKKIKGHLGVAIALIFLCGCCCVSIPPLGGTNSKFDKNNAYLINDVSIVSKPQGGT